MQAISREEGERGARKGREWKRGELYMYIVVYNCILHIKKLYIWIERMEEGGERRARLREGRERRVGEN